MKNRFKEVIKWVLIAGLAGVLGTTAYYGIGMSIGRQYLLPADASNYPESLFGWTCRAISNDEPLKFWNAVTDNYRTRFVESFDKVRKGEVDSTPWLKSATAAKLADNVEKLKSLSDKKMFLVWWNLEDRGIGGVAVPVLLKKPAAEAAAASIIKIYYDGGRFMGATKSSVLYQVSGETDVISMTRVGENWLFDEPRGMPEGI
jgi:hypothetical protein